MPIPQSPVPAPVPGQPSRPIPAERLREFPLFAALPAERLAVLGMVLGAGRYAAGEMLFRYGDPGDRLFFLCRGRVTVSLTDNVGHTETYGTVSAGDALGEVAMFAGGRRTADGRVTEDLETLELHRDDLDRFLEICPSARRMFLEDMARRLESAAHRDRNHVERVSQAIQHRRTPADKRLARLVQVLGSPWFLLSQAVFCGVWIACNRHSTSLDPFPYQFLGFLLGAEALVATLLILRYQNQEEEGNRVRDAAQDRAADEMHRRLDELLRRVPPPP